MAKNMSLKEGFFEFCKEAKPSQSWYVSLYQKTPFYGGPEEGGWWGSDYDHIAYYECKSEEDARALQEQISSFVKEWNKLREDEYHEGCRRSMDWLDARGLDADYLPEPDGAISYSTMVEDRIGKWEKRGNRYYE